jgi:hypothetical protein
MSSKQAKRQVGIYPTYTHVLFWNGSSGPPTQTGVGGGGVGGLSVGLCVCPLVCAYLPLKVSDLGKHLKRSNGT